MNYSITSFINTPSEELYRFGADGNLRMYSYDRLFYSLYGYDGGTTRTYKYSMDLSSNWVNERLTGIVGRRNFNTAMMMFLFPSTSYSRNLHTVGIPVLWRC